jgi:hypothetical protein
MLATLTPLPQARWLKFLGMPLVKQSHCVVCANHALLVFFPLRSIKELTQQVEAVIAPAQLPKQLFRALVIVVTGCKHVSSSPALCSPDSR